MSQISAFGGRITIEKPEFYCTPTDSYGILGWIETGIMILAGIAGVFSLFPNPGTQALLQVLTGSRLGEVIVIGIILLYYLALPVLRFFEGEVFALIFCAYVIVGHLFLLFGSIFGPNPGPYIFTYSFLMILAGLVKLMFLFLRKDFEQRFLPRIALFAITVGVLIAYLTLFILQLVSFLASYDGSTSL